MREAFIAHEVGVPLAVYAVSAGPLNNPSSRNALRHALNSAVIVTVRDRPAYRLLDDIGVSCEIHLTSDPALLLEPGHLSLDAIKEEGVEFERHFVGFSVRERRS